MNQPTLKPTNDYIIVEPYKDITQSLVLPDSAEGELFVVKEVGPGYLNDNGERIKNEIDIGDVVAIIGKVVVIPFKGEKVIIARDRDVIAYYREEADIPDKI